MTVDEAIRVVRGERMRVTVEDLKVAGATLGREVMRLRAREKQTTKLAKHAAATVEAALRQVRVLEEA